MKFCDKKIYQLIAMVIAFAALLIIGIIIIAIFLILKINNPIILGISFFAIFYGLIGAIFSWSSLVTWHYYDRLIAQIVLNNIVKINDLANCNNKSQETIKASLTYLIENNVLIGYELQDDKIRKTTRTDAKPIK